MKISPLTVYAVTGEPTASERAQLVWRMTDAERAEFGRGIEHACDQYRGMTQADIEQAVADLSPHSSKGN